MRYIQLNLDNTFKRLLPNNDFLFDFDHFCPPGNLSPEEKTLFNVVELIETPQPTYNNLTHSCTLTTPELQPDGNWHQVWLVEPLAADIMQKNISEAIVHATQSRLDAFARTRNYDGILSACTYASSSIPKFAQEGAYCVQMRDQTWAALYAFMAEVQAGTKPMPTTVAEVDALLPTLTWPV